MENVGDYLVCKKSFHKNGKLFKNFIFKKNKKYKIQFIYLVVNDLPLEYHCYPYYNKGKSTFSNLPDVFGYVKYFTIKNNDYNEFFLSEYFYSKKEERNLKLKQKLTKLNNFNRWKRMIL